LSKPLAQHRRLVLGGTARNARDVLELQELRLEFAEISTKNKNNFNSNISNFLKLKGNTEFYYLCHGPDEGDPNNIITLEKDYFPRIVEIIDIMPVLDMSLLTLHLWMDRRFVKKAVYDFKIGLLGRIIKKAKEKDITICLENLSEDWKDLERPFSEFPLLNLTLDVGHGELLRKENTSAGFIRAYPDRIKHLHLHDNFGGDVPEDDLHLPAGKGIVDFEGIFSALHTIGYEGTATLELRPHEIRSCLGFIKGLLV
jgi:sugar phosphate isomerase/epimerase